MKVLFKRIENSLAAQLKHESAVRAAYFLPFNENIVTVTTEGAVRIVSHWRYLLPAKRSSPKNKTEKLRIAHGEGQTDYNGSHRVCFAKGGVSCSDSRVVLHP